MTLASGTKVGPYEILSPLGAGGMGEVYRARDTKLGGDVAPKFLPEAFASDIDRMERFKRERQARRQDSTVSTPDRRDRGQTHRGNGRRDGSVSLS